MPSPSADREFSSENAVDESAIIGCLLGTAVGDALGLPYEGLSPRRAARLLGPPCRYRFLFGWGMVSDDTEHTCLVAQSLITAVTQPDAFTGDFARRLRWWLLGLPAGAGRATLRAGLRLWRGIPPERSGVFSAGNGPAMRSALLGAALLDESRRVQIARRCARVTHTDPKAEQGAVVIACAAATARTEHQPQPLAFVERVAEVLGPEGDELTALLRRAADSVAIGESTMAFAATIGLGGGVSGYVFDTIPVVVHAWLSSPRDFRGAVTAVIECGGDADTTAAIVGGLVGTAVGPDAIPAEWRGRLLEWPRTPAWIARLGIQLAAVLAGRASPAVPRLNPVALLVRNVLFLSVVLVHGLRRLFPPY